MAKLTTNPITGGYASVAKLNANFDLIEAALENTISRDGTSPNAMSADLDMNSNSILNLPNPTENTEPVTLGYLNDNFGTGAGSILADAEAAAQTALDAVNAINTTNFTIEVFSGDNSTTVFTTVAPMSNTQSTLVQISGVYQIPTTDYSVSGNTLTFTSAPPLGMDNIAVLITEGVALSTLPNDTVSTIKLQNDSVTTDKIAAGAVTATELAANSVGTTNVVDGAITLDKLAAAVQSLLTGNAVPIGTVIIRITSDTPTDYLELNNALTVKADYESLYTLLGSPTLYDSLGNPGSTHFRLPDYRGYFLRHAGANSDGLATGAALGTVTQDSLKAHTHVQTVYQAAANGGAIPVGFNNVGSNLTGSYSTQSTGGAETAPKHVTVRYLIKAR